MKLQVALLSAVLLAGCSQAPNQAESTATESAQEMPTSETKPKAMPGAEPAAPSTTPSAQDMQMSEAEHSAMQAPATAEAAAQMASATGTVESVDAKAGKITIAHGPVDALKWPAMTMAFKVTPEQVAAVKAGQKVQFDFETKGMEATITQISPAQ